MKRTFDRGNSALQVLRAQQPQSEMEKAQLLGSLDQYAADIASA